MKLPNCSKAVVRDAKIVEYLAVPLSKDDKVNYFLRFGFNFKNIKQFKTSLLEHALIRDVSDIRKHAYGINYELKCNISTPDGRNPCIITVWTIAHGADIPSFVTAYKAR